VLLYWDAFTHTDNQFNPFFFIKAMRFPHACLIVVPLKIESSPGTGTGTGVCGMFTRPSLIFTASSSVEALSILENN
jgi:hypothetical protein